jgi:hypothetical protein
MGCITSLSIQNVSGFPNMWKPSISHISTKTTLKNKIGATRWLTKKKSHGTLWVVRLGSRLYVYCDTSDRTFGLETIHSL